ncbi:MAG TPA: DUF2231 domain-containing protein [Pseudonocardiaceae bacterium]|nr:DUF2231 domain-containing protein [Pseudonocardiaceae bacterium]
MTLVKGFAGKPAHAPLTDIGIGAYTAGVAMLVAGAAGFQPAAMATASVLTIGIGLIVAIPTIITGLVDLFGIPADAPARTLGWWHLTLMSSATGMFAGTFRLQLAGYSDGKIISSALILGVISWVLLLAGGYLGGALTFVYGVRVLNRPRTAMADALIPGRAHEGD